MKLRSFFALLAASCLAVSCTNEVADVITDDTPQENELRLLFTSSTNGEVYPTTKAIATEEENAIDNLTIYVFGSSAENGTYYYIDKWTSAAAQNNGSSQFVLQPSGSGKKASIYPKQVANAKYLKLYCVANSKVIQTPASSTEFTTAPGTNVTSGTNESTFTGYFTEKVEAAGASIKTPLAMTGSTDPIHVTGNYAAVSVELKRRVARFDIDNNSARTKLTIQKISIEQANSYSNLFKDAPVANAINYPEVDYTKLTNANLGETPSALYVHPTAASNNLMLVIKGLYAGKNEVTYRVKVARTPEGGSTPTNLAIEPNHRYKLRISEVTNSEIVGYFEVEDWIDGGRVEVKPDYDQKPTLVEVKSVDGKSPFEGLDDEALDAVSERDSAIYVTDDGQFTVKVKAPADCSVKISNISGFITRATTTGWITAGNPTIEEEDGMRVSTFTFTVTTAVLNNAAPVLLTFVNEAASVDPAFQLRYRVLPPAVLTHTSNITAAPDGTYANNSKNGTIVQTKGSEKLTLNLGKKYYVNVCSPYLAIPFSTMDDDDLAITEVDRDPSTHTVTYCFDLKALPEDIDDTEYNVSFENQYDPTEADEATVTYKLELNSTETAPNAKKPADSWVNSEGCTLDVATATAPTGTFKNVRNNKLYIAFDKEVVADVPENATDLSVSSRGEDNGVYVYELLLSRAFATASDVSPCKIVFKNKLDTRKATTLTLTVTEAD